MTSFLPYELGWPTRQDLDPYLKGTGLVALGVIFVLLAYDALVLLCLLWRFIKLKTSRQIKPSADKVILVTGATSGFGLATSKRLYKLGYSVIAGYFNDQEPGYQELHWLGIQSSCQPAQPFRSRHHHRKSPNSVALEMGESHRNRLFLVPMDVRSPESIEVAGDQIEALLEEHKMYLFGVINNAGISRESPFEWMDKTAIRDLLATNIAGSMLVTRRFIRHIIEARGRVVNVASGVYNLVGAGCAVYGSTKAAIVHFSDCLNEDIAPYGASSTTVIPSNQLCVSNIIYTRVRGVQESAQKLTDAERRLYRKSIDNYTNNIYGLLKVKLNNSGDEPSQVERLYNIHVPADLDKIKVKTNPLLRWLVRLMSGSNEGSTVDGSGVIEAFEQAIRLKHPPSRIYGGDFLYRHLFGPICEFLPPSYIRMTSPKLVEVLSKP